MKQFSKVSLSRLSLLTLALLTLLAACSRTPAPVGDAAPDLAPLTFGSAGYDYAYKLAAHSTGVYAVGYTDGNLHGTPKGGGDAFVRKYDTGGALLWGKQFGTPEYDYAYGVASDGSNNAYVVGSTYGSLAGSRGGSDIFIRKYTPSGGVAWTKQFGTSTYDVAGDVAVSGSNIYVVGSTTGSIAGSSGSYDAFIRKYTASGSVAWTKQFGTSVEDLANDVAVDGSGNAYVVGYTYGSLGAANGGGVDMFIRKYNPSGGVVWTKQLHYSDYDYAQAVAVSGSSVYVVGGWHFGNNSSDPDVRVIKYTTAGTTLLDFGIGPSGLDFVSDVSADSSGFVFGGTTYTSFAGTQQGNGDGYVFKYSPSGSYLWGKQLGTSQFDATYAVLARSSSQVYVAGQTYGVLGSVQSGNSDAYLRRLNGSNGATVWTDQ